MPTRLRLLNEEGLVHRALEYVGLRRPREYGRMEDRLGLLMERLLHARADIDYAAHPLALVGPSVLEDPVDDGPVINIVNMYRITDALASIPHAWRRERAASIAFSAVGLAVAGASAVALYHGAPLLDPLLASGFVGFFGAWKPLAARMYREDALHEANRTLLDGGDLQRHLNPDPFHRPPRPPDGGEPLPDLSDRLAA